MSWPRRSPRRGSGPMLCPVQVVVASPTTEAPRAGRCPSLSAKVVLGRAPPGVSLPPITRAVGGEDVTEMLPEERGKRGGAPLATGTMGTARFPHYPPLKSRVRVRGGRTVAHTHTQH
uniref:Putative secreted protein n=1 Tax=Ixodes ricinus TaxID=34613 RepID=A0A6B0ULM1_IXORI